MRDLDEEEEFGLIGGKGQASSSSGSTSPKSDNKPDIPLCGCLSVQYYQPFFDVNTSDIWERLMMAAFYIRKDDSFMQLIKTNPDAYGPFWIATSLIFTIAVTSHISSWLDSWLSGTTGWVYDFESVVEIATLIYSFAGIAPLSIWFVLRQFGADLNLITTGCIYGYSLLPFILASIICLIPVNFIDWLTFLVAAGLSSLFLVRNLAPSVLKVAVGQISLYMLGGMATLQIILMLCIKLTFFA